MNILILWIFILLHQYIPSTMDLATLVCFCISSALQWNIMAWHPLRTWSKILDRHCWEMIWTSPLCSQQTIIIPMIELIFTQQSWVPSTKLLPGFSPHPPLVLERVPFKPEIFSTVNARAMATLKIIWTAIRWQLCGSIAAGTVGSVGTIIGVVDSKDCVEAGTGHPPPLCKSIFAFISTSGTKFIGITVNDHCHQFLSLFVSCHGSETKATLRSNSAFEMAGFNSQRWYPRHNSNLFKNFTMNADTL